MMTDLTGALTCNRYAIAPNLYHYCGPERQNDLKAYLQESVSDQGLVELLKQFETVYPYLTLIASENKILDPFDPRVVEAYWLGNSLVSRVGLSPYMKHLEEGLSLKKKMKRGVFFSAAGRVAGRSLPTHTDHVLSLYMRTGHHAIAHTIQTMDSCRISWGVVVKGIGERGKGIVTSYIVDRRPLEYVGDTLVLGLPLQATVSSIGVRPKVGDWVSMHWGYVCDVLTKRQLMNLERFTKRSLATTATELWPHAETI